jgi:hypothetical protein
MKYKPIKTKFMTKKETLRAIYDKYALSKDEDIFMLHNIAIITKTGIQKIATKEQFVYLYDVVRCDPDYVAMKCTIANKEGKVLSISFGSAEKSNVKNAQKYYLEMAEKRAKARATLIAIDAHGYLYSEDEADDFKRASNE